MNKKSQRITLIIFLLGIFMGAIDSGIVSPARTVINHGFGVSDNIGVWMITIYTLAYAVSMPIVSKFSDRYGRKKVYIISITTFAVGSALCGLTNFYGNFPLFLSARVIQAIGGGGIMPIATAFIGQSFSKEKRGTALGFVGAIYGIATILGPTLGSSVLSLAGNSKWGWIFFINIPISILILILSITVEENKGAEDKKLDVIGSTVISILILSLMYALTNLNFYHFSTSIRDIKVWPYLIIFIITLPIFIFVERKAEDPILNLKYFRDREIALTLLLSFIVGAGLMGVVFVPQFAENTLKLKSGSGGYLVTLMSVFAGIAAPIGGKLIDKFSAKLVLIVGFGCTILGAGFLSLYAVSHPEFLSVFVGLVFIGFGMGFTMGPPLNYLMLSYVKPEESSSALSTLSLIRSIGVTVSPNIMINFISEAGKQLQGNLMTKVFSLAPPIQGMPKMDISKMTMGKGSISSSLIDKLMSADVTSIVDRLKDVIPKFIDKMIPQIKNGIMESIVKGSSGKGAMPQINIDSLLQAWKMQWVNEIEKSRQSIETLYQSTINNGFRNMFIAASIVALVGFLITIMLTNGKKESLNN